MHHIAAKLAHNRATDTNEYTATEIKVKSHFKEDDEFKCIIINHTNLLKLLL